MNIERQMSHSRGLCKQWEKFTLKAKRKYNQGDLIAQVKEKAGLCTDFAPSFLTYVLLWGSLHHFQNYPSGQCFRHQLLLFTSRTLVTEAVKECGDHWVLLNSHFNEVYYCFYKLLSHRYHLVRKSMPSITCQGYISTGKNS
jgi:hypothetical protein